MKIKLKTLNNGYTRRMIEYASLSKFELLATAFINYRDLFEEDALIRTLRIVIGVTDYADLLNNYHSYSMLTRVTLNEIYSYAYTII